MKKKGVKRAVSDACPVCGFTALTYCTSAETVTLETHGRVFAGSGWFCDEMEGGCGRFFCVQELRQACKRLEKALVAAEVGS